jgi:hypothetical protein
LLTEASQNQRTPWIRNFKIESIRLLQPWGLMLSTLCRPAWTDNGVFSLEQQLCFVCAVSLAQTATIFCCRNSSALKHRFEVQLNLFFKMFFNVNMYISTKSEDRICNRLNGEQVKLIEDGRKHVQFHFALDHLHLRLIHTLVSHINNKPLLGCAYGYPMVILQQSDCAAWTHFGFNNL